MGIQGADHGVEADQFRETIKDSGDCVITRDDTPGDFTAIEYVVGEGDPPFIKWRMTLEAIDSLTPEQFEALKS